MTESKPESLESIFLGSCVRVGNLTWKTYSVLISSLGQNPLNDLAVGRSGPRTNASFLIIRAGLHEKRLSTEDLDRKWNVETGR